MYSTIFTLLRGLLPMLVIFSVVLISVRLTDIIINKKKVKFFIELFNLAFIIYILALFHVVTFQDVNYGTSNFIPLKEILRYDFGGRLFYKNVVGNLIMFLPYGFFIAHYLKIKKMYVIIGLGFVLSLTIETTQLVIGRTFDVDDIILNVMGAIVGYLLYRILNFFFSGLRRILTWMK